MEMIIRPVLGVGSLELGMSTEEVLSELGKPDEKESNQEEGINVESWHYDSHELSLLFEEDLDLELISIGVSSPQYTLWGVSLIQKSQEDLIAYLESKQQEFTIEKQIESTLIHLPNLDIDFWIEENLVIEIQISLPSEGEDNMDW